MDYFSPGLRELTRKLSRQTVRLKKTLRGRALAKAETELGLLGWQQADYDEETQRQVQEIQEVEREQSRLTNEAATLGSEIRELIATREQARVAFESVRRELEGELKKAREPHHQMERQLAEKRKIEPNFEKTIPELDRELKEVRQRYAALLALENHTAKTRQDLITLRERAVTIPNEKSDLRTQHLRTVTEIRALEANLGVAEKAIGALTEKLQQATAGWTTRDQELAEQIRTAERKREKTEKQIESLETAKANPYQRIGQVLADSHIAPLNQPEALDKVHQLRLQCGELQQRILESQAISEQEDPAVVRVSFLIWAGIAGAIILLLAAALG